MSDVIWIAILSGSGSALAVQLVQWLRGRHKDEADVGFTVGQTWQSIVTELRNDIGDLRERVTDLEGDLDREREQKKALAGEVARYKSIARSLLRHVLRLREALAQTDLAVPPMPPDIEDALTTIDLP